MKWKLLVFVATLFVVAGYFTIQTFAQQSAPPVFGCLGLGGQQCSFIQVAPPQTFLSVNGKPLQGNKRVVHYGDTITGSISYINTGNLPLSISKVGVAAKRGNYEVFFTPFQKQTILEPGQRINIPVTSHKFNYPDPPGDWSVAGRVTNTDNQSVDGNKPDLFTLVGDCTPLRSNEKGVEADADKLNQYCQGKPDDAICKEFCEYKPNLAKNCEQQPDQQNPDNQNPDGQDPNNPQPDQQQPDQQQPDNQNPDNQNPNGQDPNNPQPDQQQPDQQQPDNQNPDNQNPDNQNPDGQDPNDQQPDEQKPDDQNPIQQMQQEFQKFLDELRELLGIKN